MKSLLFAISLLTAIVPHTLHGEPRRPYRVGVILPLSGQVASLGGYVRRGIQLGYAALPPEQRDAVALEFQDDQFDNRQTLSAYRELSSRSRLDAVFVIGSPPANALAPLIERDRSILIAIGASDPLIVKDRRYAFIHWVTPSVLGKRLADELVRRDFKRIAFLSAETTGALADTEAAIAALKTAGAGNRIVYNQTFLQGETDYRSVINTLRKKKADVVSVVLFPGALAAFATQARTLKLGAEIAGMETLEDESEIKAAGGALTGAWYANASDPTDEFVDLYTTTYGEHPGWAAANGFDSITLLAQAVAAAKDGNEDVRAFLASVRDHRGAAGTYSASGDNRFLLPAALKRITTRGFEKIARSAPPSSEESAGKKTENKQ